MANSRAIFDKGAFCESSFMGASGLRLWGFMALGFGDKESDRGFSGVALVFEGFRLI